MNAELEKMPTCSIVYMRQIGPYGVMKKQLMKIFKSWVKSKGLFNKKSIILGIAQDNPVVVKSENCRYDACLVVPDDYCVKINGVRLGNISGGRYVVFKINHTVEAVQKAWNEMFLKLDNLGLESDETRPILERYLVEFLNNHYCEICITLQ